MRENLLKKQPTWGLRRAQGTGQKSATPATLTKVILVLLTMLLLPSAAWGQGNDYISSTFSGINLGQGEGSGPISYNSATATTSTTDASTLRITQGSTATGWDVKNLSANYSICTGANNETSSETNFVLRPIDVGQANTITFTLESQFGINGKFVKAEIIYNYSYIKSITADANKKAGSEIISLVNSNVSFTCSESGTAEEATGTITANASDYSNMVFDNNNIDLSFTVTTAAVQSGIPSFTISEIRLYFEDVTEQSFNIWVNSEELTSQNITTFLGGKLGYTQPDGNKPAILHLKGTTAIESIYTTLENLEIHLSGENKIAPSSQVANGICSSQSRDEGTLTFTAEEGGSLTIATGVSVIRGFGKCTGNLETHEPYNITNYRTNGLYYYLSTNSEGTDTTTIKWLKITEAQTYPLWIAGTQVTESNNGNVLGDSKVSFTPADGNNDATLTLSGANIIGGVDWSGSDNLTIALNGENSITNIDGDVLKNSNVSTPHPSLSFTKTENATIGKLTLTTSPDSQFKTIAEFGSHTGLYDLGETENEEVKTRVITSSLLSGGSGTSGDPFKITTAQDLKDFSSYISKGVLSNEYFSLGDNDIDCEGLTDFEPIDPFTGTFDGNNKTISGLIITTSKYYVGLFGQVNGGIVKNLTLDNLTIEGGTEVGGIAGTLYGDNGKITNCKVNNSTITCGEHAQNPEVGGIAGRISAEISNCEVSASTITAITDNTESSGATAEAGGIVGHAEGGEISSCITKSTTTVTCNHTKGGTPFAGAVIGLNNTDAGTVLSANEYESSVTTTAGGTTSSGQDQRGIGSSSDELNKVMMAGTKKVTISTTGLSGDRTLNLSEEMGSTYCLDERDASTGQLTALYVLPGSTISLDASSEEGYKPTFTLSISDVIVPPDVIVTPTEGDDFWKIKYEFSMPEDDVTATIAFARDLGSQLYTLETEQEVYTYTGEGIEPSISLTISTDLQNPVPLTKDTDYEIQKCMKYVDGTPTPIYEEDGKTPKTPVDVGSYQVYISGIGSYTGEAVLEFSITKATTDECIWFYHLVDGKEEQVLSVEEATYGTAYDAPKLKNPLNLAVTLSCNAENGSNGTASDVATIDDEGNITILKAGTVYVYAVTEGNENYEAGEVHYQLDIEKGSLENVTITEIDDQVYTGTAIEPELTVTTPDGTSVTTDDYSITYSDNINAGEATITLTAKEASEKFEGSTTTTFNILQADLSKVVLNLTDLAYNGTDQKGSVSVTEVWAGENADLEVGNEWYTVKYPETAKEVGTYEVTVTANDATGNNFKGTATATFNIVNRTVTSEELGLSDSQSSGTYYSETEDLQVPEGVVAYIITGINGNSVTTQRVSYIPKGVAVLTEKGQSSESANDAIPYPSTLPLKGTLEPVDVTSVTGGTVYVLYNGEFVKSTSGTIPSHRCYLLVATNVASGTRSFSIDHGDGTTALREVKSEGVKGEKLADGEWYTLQGRKFTTKPTKPGLYILNGKKVVIK